MYAPVTQIEVKIWGKRVGATALDPNLGYYAFEYDPKFVRTGIELSPLMLPLSNTEPVAFTNLPEATFRRLPAMLADALPDEFGNALIDSWLAGQGVTKESITSLDRLAYMGRRGVGALEFKPDRLPRSKTPTALKMADLVESARLALNAQVETDDASLAALQQIIDVGTSAGGARAKAAIAFNAATQEIRSGQFDAPAGFEHWLLKFDGLGSDNELGATKHYGRIEYAYSLMARAAGIAMTPCRLFEENGRAHFMTRRFDRDADEKHHLQTLCAIAHLDYKQRATHSYMQYFQTISSMGLDYPALEQGYRRMVFNVLARNCDDHTKNLSFLLRKGGAWELSPAYDVTHAFNPDGKWTYQHQMAVDGRFTEVDKNAMLNDAARVGIGRATEIISEVRDAIGAWKRFAAEAGLERTLAKKIESDFPKL